MSRAFTKEVDDAPPAPIADRAVSSAANLVTRRGAALIEAELARIDAELTNTLDGATSALQLERRYWASRRSSMQIITPPNDPTVVSFGTSVTIKRSGKVSTLVIAGEDEANPTLGLLAWTSPLARAIDGAHPGESVELEAAGHSNTIEVLRVFAPPDQNR